jgi:hypothetical protein
MNNSLFVFAVIGFMSGTLLTSCEKTAEQKLKGAIQNVGEAKQELKGDKSEFLAEWQTFKTECEQTLQDNEKKINAFKEKMEKAGPKVKAKYSKEVAVLEQNNRDLKKKLGDYKDEGQGKWVEFKTNFKHDMDGIGKKMTDLFKDND